MEVWARVASFIPFPSLLSTFWALTDAGLLPETQTNPSNAFLQFCSEIADADDQVECNTMHDTYTLLLEMGFDHDIVTHALHICRGNLESVLDYIMHQNLYG